MQRRLFIRSAALLASITVVAATAASTATAEAPTPAAIRLDATLDAILADARLAGGQAGVAVVDAASGNLVYERNSDRRLIPGSNTKLLTSAAALELLGPGHRFTTDVRTTGNRQGDLLRGDLHLRGGGDPTMLAADYDALAASVAASGIQVVSGNLVADDTRYDGTRLGPDWAWDDESYYYAAQVSALTVAPNSDYDAGTVIVGAAPAAAANVPPVITLTPATGYLRIDNRARTVSSGATTISFQRQHGTNTVVVTGQIAVGAGSTSNLMTVWEPSGYAADVFRAALRRHGVAVAGGTVLGRATPATAQTVATHRSMTLAELMVPFLKLSNNGHAEVLTKEIGRVVAGAGTWSAGLNAITGYLNQAGMNAGTFGQRDGSGLSRANLIPPKEFVDLLVAVRAEPWFATWYAALPVAGNADRLVGGTLRSRMTGTPAANNVRAKSGSLTAVSGLTGYVTDADGRLLAFSVVLNNYLASSVKSIEDQIAVTLASYTAQSTSSARVAPPAVGDNPTARTDIECSWIKPSPC